MESKAILQHFPVPLRTLGAVWRHQPAYRRPRHFHPETELNFVTRGRARLAVGPGFFDLSAGSLIWLVPGQSHELVEASDDLELWVVGATPAFAEACGAVFPASPTVRPLHRLLTEPASLELLARCRATVEGTYEAGAEDALAAIYSCARTGTQAASPPLFDAVVTRALAHLLVRPDLSRGSLARQIRVSQAELSRRFHAQVGIPLQEYRHRLRTMRFIRQLQEGETNYLRAALEAGFGSYSQCFRTFAHVTGYAPREYFRDGRKVLESAVSG